ncbi:cupin domain-containing protein [Salinibacter grassmerensis]|uniref:cupin domain-containing protein n=1 Tax=Salinibacter grassmerensis TaxID=3040353 RepID=UPI0021E708CC|nr:cupin domain-containing protein [Salinibacter grassmerensis]
MAVPDALADVLRAPDVQAHWFADDGTFPNNETLPALVVKKGIRHDVEDCAQVFERLFRRHDWHGAWRNGIYAYPHYHSTAHEVLGVASGTARVQLGGPEGDTFNVTSGDALVLPAGVAHKNLGADRDFLVVGAYPAACPDWDLKRGRPGERPDADRNIEQVPRPRLDPLYGADGPLPDHWGAVT